MTKQHILDEIRRTSKANGGVSLGKDRFLQATGSREADWKGKFWARWGEAIREAGMQPNRFNTTAYDENVMIEKLVAVIREFGRFPVVAEIRMKKRYDPTLPNEKTYRRFGSKQQFAAKILDYCNRQTGYEDVAGICRATMNASDVATETNHSDTVSTVGFVYLIKAVGITGSVEAIQ
jgi:hypothetical protein